jgi:hypothetical protein
MKKTIYIVAFMILGAMLGFFLHAVIEIFYIKLLLKDFSKFGLGLSWSNWEMIHLIGVPLLTLGLAWCGYRQGKKWWRILYVEQKYLKRWGVKLRKDF